jgi:hypothetical protein
MKFCVRRFRFGIQALVGFWQLPEAIPLVRKTRRPARIQGGRTSQRQPNSHSSSANARERRCVQSYLNRTTIDGVRHGLWHAVDERSVQETLLQRHRNTEAAKPS